MAKRIYNTQLRMLVIQYLFNYKGSTVKEIKDQLKEKYVTITQVLHYMLNSGLVTRKKNTVNVYQYYLTEKSNKIYMDDYANEYEP
jgi:DNA-binding MarR family transcriptional regulator